MGKRGTVSVRGERVGQDVSVRAGQGALNDRSQDMTKPTLTDEARLRLWLKTINDQSCHEGTSHAYIVCKYCRFDTKQNVTDIFK